MRSINGREAAVSKTNPPTPLWSGGDRGVEQRGDLGEAGTTRSGVSTNLGEAGTTRSGASADLGEAGTTRSGASADLGEVGTTRSGASADLGEVGTTRSEASADLGEAGTMRSGPPCLLSSGVAGVEAALAAELGGEEGHVALHTRPAELLAPIVLGVGHAVLIHLRAVELEPLDSLPYARL